MRFENFNRFSPSPFPLTPMKERQRFVITCHMWCQTTPSARIYVRVPKSDTNNIYTFVICARSLGKTRQNVTPSAIAIRCIIRDVRAHTDLISEVSRIHIFVSPATRKMCTLFDPAVGIVRLRKIHLNRLDSKELLMCIDSTYGNEAPRRRRVTLYSSFPV